MHRSTPVPLIRQSEARPVLDVLRGIGAPIRSLIAQAELPASFQDPSDGFIPARSMLRFIGLSAQGQDIPDLCWRAVHRARPDQLGSWGCAVARCSTLRSAILEFCNRYARDVPFVELGLEVGEGHAWFWRRRPAQVAGWEGDHDAEQFMMSAMIRVVRSAACPRWVPSHVRLESSTATWIFGVPELANCRIDFGSPVMAVAVPYDLLDQRVLRANAIGPGAGEDSNLSAAEESLAGSLQQAVAALLPAVRPSIELAGEITGLSPRTLRRRLAGEGTGWRRVVDRARLDACVRLLRDPQRSLGTIAAELGYSDQANMTRAFRRWTGESPSAYRWRMLVSGLTSPSSGTS
jgi:AraC-like DNA-binding protein